MKSCCILFCKNKVPISLHFPFFFFLHLEIWKDFFLQAKYIKCSKKLLTCYRVDMVKVNYVSIYLHFVLSCLKARGHDCCLDKTIELKEGESFLNRTIVDNRWSWLATLESCYGHFFWWLSGTCHLATWAQGHMGRKCSWWLRHVSFYRQYAVEEDHCMWCSVSWWCQPLQPALKLAQRGIGSYSPPQNRGELGW